MTAWMGAAVLGITGLQLFALDRKISWLDESAYLEAAYDLRVKEQKRIGYLHEHHGVEFVRTVTSRPIGDRSPEWEEDQALGEFLTAELQRVPKKAFAEGLWYLFVFVLLTWGFAKRSGSPKWRMARRGALTLLGAWWILLLPLAIGYGQPVYTNWVGPGAASWSGPYIEPSWTPGLTVSYRPIVEIAGLLPARAGAMVDIVSFVGEMPWVVFLGLSAAPGLLVLGGLAGWSLANSTQETIAEIAS